MWCDQSAQSGCSVRLWTFTLPSEIGLSYSQAQGSHRAACGCRDGLSPPVRFVSAPGEPMVTIIPGPQPHFPFAYSTVGQPAYHDMARYQGNLDGKCRLHTSQSDQAAPIAANYYHGCPTHTVSYTHDERGLIFGDRSPQRFCDGSGFRDTLTICALTRGDSHIRVLSIVRRPPTCTTMQKVDYSGSQCTLFSEALGHLSTTPGTTCKQPSSQLHRGDQSHSAPREPERVMVHKVRGPKAPASSDRRVASPWSSSNQMSSRRA